MSTYLDNMTRGFLAAAEFTDTGDTDQPEAGLTNSGQAEQFARARCDSFLALADTLLDDIEAAQAGHDLWLTTNGHGVGFWDRGLGDLGDKLTELCKQFPEVYMYAENGFYYLESC